MLFSLFHALPLGHFPLVKRPTSRLCSKLAKGQKNSGHGKGCSARQESLHVLVMLAVITSPQPMFSARYLQRVGGACMSFDHAAIPKTSPDLFRFKKKPVFVNLRKRAYFSNKIFISIFLRSPFMQKCICSLSCKDHVSWLGKKSIISYYTKYIFMLSKIYFKVDVEHNSDHQMTVKK